MNIILPAARKNQNKNLELFWDLGRNQRISLIMTEQFQNWISLEYLWHKGINLHRLDGPAAFKIKATPEIACSFMDAKTVNDLDKLYTCSPNSILQCGWYVNGQGIPGIGFPPKTIQEFLSEFKHQKSVRSEIIELMKGHGATEHLIRALELLCPGCAI